MRIPPGTVLLIIDVQTAIDDPVWGPRSNAGAEDRIAALLAAWREARFPVIHIRHDSSDLRSPYRPGQLGAGLKPQAMPAGGELVAGPFKESGLLRL